MKHRELETTPEISERMKKVHTKGGKAERLLAKALWHEGVRYRLNYKKLPGSPDIAITKYKIAVFIDGDFWHGRDWDTRKEGIKSNRDYWLPKIEENIRRDQRNDLRLNDMGWVTYHFWERDILKNMEECKLTVLEAVRDRQ